MKLPNANALIVERGKILEYLLNPLHRYGAVKERFFTAFGFRADDWEILAESLCEHGRRHEIVRTHETSFGPRYIRGRRIEYARWSESSCTHCLAIR